MKMVFARDWFLSLIHIQMCIRDRNKGYATESAKECLTYGFENLKLKKIIGRAMKDNIGSIKVLEKIGLEYEKDVNFDGQDAVIYKIEK